MRLYGLSIFLFFFLGACSSKEVVTPDKLFEKVSAEESGISFVNEIENTPDFNIFSYRNFYNGAGVALGDVNNDGLTDIYFTRNSGQNKLYINKGNFQFEDVTDSAGVGGSKAWSTGVVMVDINNDGLLDIYVCNAGYVKGDDQENELFINQGDLKFTEAAAQYGLNQNGYTTHAAFFDYDLDGDLDVYILNNSFIPVNTLNNSNRRELDSEDWPVRDFLKGGGDKLLRNENGFFQDVTDEAGIYSSLIGFGLGITIGDINNDHLPDMYVSNDFYERDYLYINQGDGTFREDIKNWMEHLSLSSMGADMADINNDGYPEIFVTEMLPDSEYRLKTKTLFEKYSTYYLKLQRDFYHQYMHNTLQLNNQNNAFSEVAWYSGVAASDWSWGALMFDADNDGYRDIYVCNGVYQDVTDQDFIDFFADEVVQKMALTGEKEEMEKVIARIPSEPQLNKMFRNRGDITFADIGPEWGFDKPSFSNGAAYGDLDNDGDLDLVVNNLNQEAFIYRNRTSQQESRHYLGVSLKGSRQNTYAIGAKISAYRSGEVLNFEVIPTRGFQSSVDYRTLFGLGNDPTVDSLVVVWPDRTSSLLLRPPVDTMLTLDYTSVHRRAISPAQPPEQAVASTWLREVDSPFADRPEDDFVDFFQEGLSMRMLSREGPRAAVVDLNNDGLDDVLIGGAAGTPAQLYLQRAGKLELQKQNTFEAAAGYEDTAICFFDADGDGDQDVFLGSGGNHRPAGSRPMQDRIYLNDGKGNFSASPSALPINGLNTSVVLPWDVDADGDLDLFVGSRSIPNQYGVPPRSFLYENNGEGRFRDATGRIAKELLQLGMVTDATLADLDGTGQLTLVIVGEWMAPMFFEMQQGQLVQRESDLSDHHGWWFNVEAEDLDGDGDQDLILGNRGENFYFSGDQERPAKLWVWDFDRNGSMEKIITRTVDGKDMPVPLKKELTEQIVSLKKQNLKHTEFATKSIQDLFEPEVLRQAKVWTANYFKSAVAYNNGNTSFSLQALPTDVQLSCVCGIFCSDLNGDQLPDLILAGNDGGFTPQFSKLDASFGHVLQNRGAAGFESLQAAESGFFLRGDVKQLLELKIDGVPYLLATVNNAAPKLFAITIEQNAAQ